MKSPIFSVCAAVAVFSAVACGDPPKSSPPSTTGGAESKATDGDVTATAFSPDKVVFEGPGLKLQPRFGKWTLASAPRYFGADNLYDLINGGSEIFVDFGFTRIATADYRIGNEPRTITVEIYHMGTPLGAFGRVARYLENLADPSKAGEKLPASLAPFGIMGDGDLIVWKQEFIVHLTLIDESADATPQSITAAGLVLLPEIATAILARIDGSTELPADLKKFPHADMIGRSETWHPAHIAGISSLREGFAARYRNAAGASWSLFFSTNFTSEALAATAAEEAQKTLTENGIVALKRKGTRIFGVLKDGEAVPAASIVKTQLAALEATL